MNLNILLSCLCRIFILGRKSNIKAVQGESIECVLCREGLLREGVKSLKAECTVFREST